jgi:uncharacterized membrane protein HdeD (DUF308 family)
MANNDEMTLSTLQDQLFGNLQKNWGWLLALGILSLVLGSFGIFASFGMTMASILAFGLLMIVTGGFQLVQVFFCKGWKSILWHGLIGFLYLCIGVLLIMDPILASMTLTLVIAATLLAIGLLRCVMSFELRPADGWYWSLISGLISIALGVLIFVQWPTSGFWVIGLFVAVELIFSGWSSVFIALAARKAGQRPAPMATYSR